MLTTKIKLLFIYFRMVMLKKFKICATRSRRLAFVVVGVVVFFVLSVHLLLNRHYKISEYCYDFVVLTYHLYRLYTQSIIHLLHALLKTAHCKHHYCTRIYLHSYC